MAHYILRYTYSEDYLARRESFRAEHLQRGWAAHARGELFLAGALAEPADAALLIFNVDDPQKVAEFAQQDPYVIHGLVTDWEVRPWTTVIGEHAATPLKP